MSKRIQMDAARGGTLPVTEDESKDIAKLSVLEKPNQDKFPTSARRKNRKYKADRRAPHVSSAHAPTYKYGEADTRCTEPKVISCKETTPKEATHRKTRPSHAGDRKVKPVSGAEDVKLHKAEQPWKPKCLQQQYQTESSTSPRRTQDMDSTGAHDGDREVMQVSRYEGVTLHKAKNPWKPRRLEPKEYTDEEELFMEIRGILNKLTPQTFKLLISRLQRLKIDSEQKLNGLADLVFEKAISEPLYTAVYANMCRCLSMYKVKSEHREGKMVNFRALLLTRCERENRIYEFTEVKQADLEKLENENERLKLKSEIEQRKYKMKSKLLGTFRFVGELFKIKLLTANTIHDLVFRLLKYKDNMSLECACVLFTAVGKEFEVEKAKPRIYQYFRQMSKITNEKKCSSTVRCLLLNVIDLRANKWIPRRPENTPKTIDQVHKEVAEERQENDLPSFQSVTSATVAHKGFATSATVSHKGFATSATVAHKGFATSATVAHKGFATSETVAHKGFTTSATVAHKGFATSATVAHKGFATSATVAHKGFATSATVAHKGFATITTKTIKANEETMNREEPFTSEEMKVDKQEDESAVAQKSRGIPMRTIKNVLYEYLVKGTANNNGVISWIDCNVEESVTRGNTFIRTLITDICKHALEKDDIRGCLIDVDKIRDRRDLLRKYLKHNPDLELQALYALQLFVGKRKCPPGNIRGILDVLYGADIISEDGFFKWDTSEEMKECKETTKKQIVPFFTWLLTKDKR